MFSFHNFILSGLKDAVGKMADYQVILNSAAWQEKGVLTDSDLQEISDMIEEKNKPVPEEQPEPEPMEELPEPVDDEVAVNPSEVYNA